MSENYRPGLDGGLAEDDGRWASPRTGDEVSFAVVWEPNNAPAVSFDSIYNEWFDRVCRWVRSLGARGCDQEDVAQEVFAIVFRQLHLFDGANIAGWLYQIARRKARDYRELAWVHRIAAPESSVIFDAAPYSGPGPLDALETKHKLELFKRRLEMLPSEQRMVFVLFELEGCSGNEIAERQQVPVNTVWMRLHTARQKLCAAPARPKTRSPSR